DKEEILINIYRNESVCVCMCVCVCVCVRARESDRKSHCECSQKHNGKVEDLITHTYARERGEGTPEPILYLFKRGAEQRSFSPLLSSPLCPLSLLSVLSLLSLSSPLS